MVNWPAIIKHAGDAELVYISDQSQWESDSELQQADYDESDLLIDSQGHTFNLVMRENQPVQLQPRAQSISLVEILGLVKAHAAQKGSCCVAKLYAPTIKDALVIVASLDEL
jgi:hypothetical protein